MLSYNTYKFSILFWEWYWDDPFLFEIYLLVIYHSTLRSGIVRLPFKCCPKFIAEKIYLMDYKLGYVSREEFVNLIKSIYLSNN